jgi:hypothetical protein
MANAKFTTKKTAPVPYASKDRHRGGGLIHSTPDGRRQKPPASGVLDRKSPRSDPAQNGQGQGFGRCSEDPQSRSGDRRLELPATNCQSRSGDQRLESPATSCADSKKAASTIDSNSKFDEGGVIRGAQSCSGGMVYIGRRTSRTGLEHTSTGPNIGYRPAPGLIKLFNKTWTERRNPNTHTRSTTPPKHQTPRRRSNAEIMRNGMDGSRQFGSRQWTARQWRQWVSRAA